MSNIKYKSDEVQIKSIIHILNYRKLDKDKNQC